MLGTIQSIQEVENFKIQPVAPMTGGNGSQRGLGQLIKMLGGYSSYDGYKISTDDHIVHILIENGQSCCEDFGYFSSDDDLQSFVGAELDDIELTDMALNTVKVNDMLEYGLDDGGIQFVNFKTDKGTFQLAVYNNHNGYYGHSILVAKDEDLLVNTVL